MKQGRFEIISLSGSFLLAQDGDTRSRTGGLSVALAGSDGRVLGGCVAGMLMASTPVQVSISFRVALFCCPKIHLFLHCFCDGGLKLLNQTYANSQKYKAYAYSYDTHMEKG